MKKELSFIERYRKGLSEFNASLSPPFKDARLLEEVFTHSSFLNEAVAEDSSAPTPRGPSSNERLEFLGDAVLDAAISHILFDRYPHVQEGGLTQLRARLVNRRVLSGLARRLGLGEHLLMSRGLTGSGGADNERILAGLFEAYLGGRYLEEGFNEFFARVERLFSVLIEDAVKEPGYFDYKPALQELVQRLFGSTPRYSVAASSGSAHDRTYEVEVSVNGRIYGRGTGKSKKEAEQSAAGHALAVVAREDKAAEPASGETS